MKVEHEILGWKSHKESIHSNWCLLAFWILCSWEHTQKSLIIINMCLWVYYTMTSLLIQFFFIETVHSWNFHHFHAARLLKVVQAVIRILRYGHGITLKKRIKCFSQRNIVIEYKYTILQTKKLSQDQRVKKGLKKIFIFFFQCENNSQSLVP